MDNSWGSAEPAEVTEPDTRCSIDLREVSVIVVHHRNFPGVLETLQRIIASGVPAANITIADNSEDDAITAALTASVPPGVIVRSLPNLGYAAAINACVPAVLEGHPKWVLVSTHEVLPALDCVAQLVAAMENDETLAVVGPALLRRFPNGEEIAFSYGARFTRLLALPRHAKTLLLGEHDVVIRDWLDGAFCLYRPSVLAHQLREDFFLYVEEVEFHRRLAAKGWRIGCVVSATASQATDGIPARLESRNLQVFYRLWGNRSQRLLSVPYVIARRFAVAMVRRQFGQALHGLRGGVCGWSEGRRRNLDTDDESSLQR